MDGSMQETSLEPRRNWFLVGILLAGLVAVGVTLVLRQLPPGLTKGVWLSELESVHFVLDFAYTGALISGTMHELHESQQVVQWGFAGTRRANSALELNWGVDSTLSLEVDLESNVLRGSLRGPDGALHDMVFHRVEAATVPGLMAKPQLPYELRAPEGGSGWEIAAPAEVGIDPKHLEATYRAVTRSEAGLLHSLLVIRGGKLVSEEYFHGYSRENLHEIQSVTKSITSLLVGMALDSGQIESIDEPVLTYFPEFAETAASGWKDVTLRHLLTMTAGIGWDRREINQGHGTGPELFRKVFSRRVVHEPGSRWLYNGAEVNLLAGVMHRATGMHVDAYAARHLFAPLNITVWDWETGKSEGYPSLAGTLRLRPLDMARIGQLVLDRGRWQGRQVVSEGWIDASTAPTIHTQRDVQRYGYLWWRLGAPLDAGPHPVTIASGWGSQFIHIVPAFDAVLVTTGGNHFNSKTFAIDQVLLQNLVPGIER